MKCLKKKTKSTAKVTGLVKQMDIAICRVKTFKNKKNEKYLRMTSCYQILLTTHFQRNPLIQELNKLPIGNSGRQTTFSKVC